MGTNVQGLDVSPNETKQLLPAVSLRDYLAGQVMMAEIQRWNAEISIGHREQIVMDWQQRFGNVTIHECIAFASYEMADAMLYARDGR